MGFVGVYLGVCKGLFWCSIRGPLGVHWESIGGPLGVHWRSIGGNGGGGHFMYLLGVI